MIFKKWFYININTFRVRQIIISLGPILITISLGLAEGYSAILLPQLQEDPDWNIDTELTSWIASIAALPMFVGCLLGGWLMEVIGRKILHLATCMPNLIGWLFIAFSNHNIILLLIGRFMTGMCVGVLSPVLMIYIAETSDPLIRGLLLSSVTLALNLGIALSHLLGTYLHWNVVALLACIFPIACFVLMVFVPESPTYLIKMGHVQKAKDVFIWIRGDSDTTNTELNNLISQTQYEINVSKKKINEHFKIIKKPEFYKPLIILMVLFSTMQFSGCNPMAFYTVSILTTVLESSLIDSYETMLIMDGIRIIASILGCFAQQYMKRKKLIILSCSGTIISLTGLSVYLFLINNYYVQDFPIIIIICFITYILFINVGLLPISYSMTGELFAQPSRGLGSGLVTCFNMILMFIVVKITPWLFEVLSPDKVFLMYSLSCLIGLLILIIILPETFNKPLYEIEEYFRGHKKKKKINDAVV